MHKKKVEILKMESHDSALRGKEQIYMMCGLDALHMLKMDSAIENLC